MCASTNVDHVTGKYNYDLYFLSERICESNILYDFLNIYCMLSYQKFLSSSKIKNILSKTYNVRIFTIIHFLFKKSVA